MKNSLRSTTNMRAFLLKVLVLSGCLLTVTVASARTKNQAQADRLIVQGSKYFERGQYEAATGYLKRAVDLSPRYDLAHLWLGRTYHRWGVAAANAGNKDAALLRYQGAVKHYKLTIKYSSLQSRKDKAKKWLSELQPKPPPPPEPAVPEPR